jgi:hypothetical protein
MGKAMGFAITARWADDSYRFQAGVACVFSSTYQSAQSWVRTCVI